MQPFNKFQFFVQDIANKVHNLGSDQLSLALTDTIPVATNHVLADLTQISYTNLSSRNITTTSSTQTSGVYKLILTNITLTATGTVAQFRYVVLYNNTAGSGNLIGWWDYGSEVNMINGASLPITFDASNGVIQNT